jgi:hypothetical protein
MRPDERADLNPRATGCCRGIVRGRIEKVSAFDASSLHCSMSNIRCTARGEPADDHAEEEAPSDLRLLASML